MENNALATYEKPVISYWPAEELNGIEAKMSGGGGGGVRLKWADNWVYSGSEGDYSLEIGIVATLVAAIATKNLTFSYQVGAGVAANIAGWFVSKSLPIIYYTQRVQHLYIYAGTMVGGYEAWDLVGSAVRAEYYGDASRSNYAGKIEFNNVPAMFSYMLQRLSW